MKTWLSLFSLAALLAAPISLHAQDAPPPPQGYSAPDNGAPPPPDAGGGDADDSGVSFQQFYDQLGSQGQWIQTDDYGYVFQPTVQDPQWAPYTDGHWVYSDQGWVWVSDEPWGWATYHYGRWANLDGTGWCWVPGYQWAPAWVSWRYGGGYAGWAPLPPATFVGVEFGGGGGGFGGFHFGGDVDVSFGIGAGCYNFVDVGFLGDDNYRGRYIDRSRNFVVINNTTNITNIVVNRGGAGAGFRGVNVGGPQINEVNAHAHTRIPTVALAAAGQPGRSTLSGNTLSVYSPRVNAATMRSARPAQVAATVNHAKLNRGDSVTRPLEVTRTVHAPAPSPEAVQAAQTAQAHAPANAHIATTHTPVRKTLSRPLTQMEPSQAVNRAAAHTATSTAPATERPALENRNAPGAAPFTGESHATTTPAETEAREREADRANKESAAHTQEQDAATARTQAAAEEKARTEATQQERERTEATQAQEQRERAATTEQHSAAPEERERTTEPSHTVEHPAEHTQVEHAPAQHAAPEQHAAPAQKQGGGDKADKKQGQ
jgi:hypothetical protein